MILHEAPDVNVIAEGGTFDEGELDAPGAELFDDRLGVAAGYPDGTSGCWRRKPAISLGSMY
jgi:hypothetical protein